MTWEPAFFYLIGGLSFAFLVLFCLTSLQEKRRRATLVSGGLALSFALGWSAIRLLVPAPVWLLIPSGLVTLTGVLFFLPFGRKQGISSHPDTTRVDQRDVIFSREEYRPGDGRYEAYYERHPELRARDDRFRRLPELLEPGSKLYDPVCSVRTRETFDRIEDLTTEVDGPVAEVSTVRDDAVANTAEIGSLILEAGANEVAVARLDPAFVYSHVGRGPEPWGEAIKAAHRYAIVFTMEMKYEAVEQAPWPPITEESANRYLQGSKIATEIARRIREMGYPARAHVAGSNYQIMLPPVARDAGLGELGRFGYLVSRKMGSRVRLGAITTDLPLIAGDPADFGVREFCEICRRCADNCPSGSIPRGAMTEVRSVMKWPLEVESCLHLWRFMGTDCGLCMKVCPFSHPRTFVHQVIRFGIEQSAFARRLALLGENLFYGKRAPLPPHSRVEGVRDLSES